LTTFRQPGGFMDFRIDFIACCLFGTFHCVVVRSHFFEQRWLAVLAGAVAAGLVLFRFLTLVYFAGILGVFLAVASLRMRAAAPGSPDRLRLSRSVQGLVLAALVLLTLTAPWIWHNRQPMWHYYLLRHVTRN